LYHFNERTGIAYLFSNFRPFRDRNQLLFLFDHRYSHIYSLCDRNQDPPNTNHPRPLLSSPLRLLTLHTNSPHCTNHPTTHRQTCQVTLTAYLPQTLLVFPLPHTMSDRDESRDESRDAQIAGALRKAVADAFRKDPESVTLRTVRNEVAAELGLGEGFFKSDPYWKDKSKEIVLQEGVCSAAYIQRFYALWTDASACRRISKMPTSRLLHRHRARRRNASQRLPRRKKRR